MFGRVGAAAVKKIAYRRPIGNIEPLILTRFVVFILSNGAELVKASFFRNNDDVVISSRLLYC